MSESNLPPIFSTTEPALTDNGNDQDDFDPSLMQSFRDEVLASFDDITPRMNQLERTLSKAISTSQIQRDRSNFSFGDDLNEVQRDLKETHSQVIDMSRRIQSLTLTSQSSAALAIPRLLRPVNEKFCDFKSEFDSSLKKLANLSGKITQKSQTISNSIEATRKLPSLISEMKTNISSYSEKIKENEKTIKGLSEKALHMIEETEHDINEEIKKQIAKAENMLKEMEESANKGETEADDFSERMQENKESLRKSFTSLTQDIEKVTNEHLNELNTAIETSSKKSNSLMESIQNQLSDELDQVMKNISSESEDTVVDQLNQAHEEAQLISLMTKLEKLQERINNYDKSSKNENNNEIEEEEEDNDSGEEIFTSVVDGVTIKYYCKADGTFHT